MTDIAEILLDGFYERHNALRTFPSGKRQCWTRKAFAKDDDGPGKFALADDFNRIFGEAGAEFFLAVNEALLNYQEHAAPGDEIRAEYWRTDTHAYAIVQGKKGFDPALFDSAHPAFSLHSLSKRGWGDRWMRALADYVCYDPDMKGVILVKELALREAA